MNYYDGNNSSQSLSHVFIICNGIFIEECRILKRTKDFYTLQICSTNQGLRVRPSRVYKTKSEAEKALKGKVQ